MESGIDVSKWLSEAKKEAAAKECGMFLIHNGVVRVTSKAEARQGISGPAVCRMNFSYDVSGVDAAVGRALHMPGIKLVKVWLADGVLSVGDDIMYVMVGGDIRPHVIECLNELVGEIKNKCVTEDEIYSED